MKLTNEMWEQIIDEESQARGIEAPHIQRVSRRSIERVLSAVPETGKLTTEEMKRVQDMIFMYTATRIGSTAIDDIARLLSRRPAPAYEAGANAEIVAEAKAVLDRAAARCAELRSQVERYEKSPYNAAADRIAELERQLAEAKRSRDSFSGMWKRSQLENEELENELAETKKAAEIADDKLHRISRHVVEGAAKIIKAPREPA